MNAEGLKMQRLDFFGQGLVHSTNPVNNGHSVDSKRERMDPKLWYDGLATHFQGSPGTSIRVLDKSHGYLKILSWFTEHD